MPSADPCSPGRMNCVMRRLLSRGADHKSGPPEAAHGRSRVARGHERLADEHGVVARFGERGRVLGPDDARLGHLDDARREATCATRTARSVSTSKVTRSRWFTPINVAPAASARSSSPSSCTSTSASSPSSIARAWKSASSTVAERSDDQQTPRRRPSAECRRRPGRRP